MSSDKIHRVNGTVAEDNQIAPADDDIRRVRYGAKQEEDGSALNADRETMFDDLTDVGESGSQGGNPQREDQYKIGPNGQP